MTALSMKERIAAARGAIAENRSRGVRPYKFKNGKTLFRILPAKDQVTDFWKEFGQIYLKSFDGKDLVVIGDKFLTYGEEDPIREMVFDGMKHAPTPDIKEHYKEMLGGPRVLFQALVLNDKDVKPGEPQLIELSQTQFDNILAQFQMYLDIDENHDLSSLARGHVFQCEREGTTKNDTKYSFLATPQPAPLGETILERLHDLDGWVKALFEAKEQKALQLLSKMGVNVGAASSVSAVLTAPAQTAGAIATTVAPVTVANAAVAPATVTTAIDADVAAAIAGIQDAEFTPITAAATAPTPVGPDVNTPAVAPEPVIPQPVETPAPTPATKPVQPAQPLDPIVAPEPVVVDPADNPAPVSTGSADIDAILASLD